MERTKKEIDMDYEKKYKEALKDMRVIYPNLRGDAKLAAEHAFPELRESEDEKIRRTLVEYFGPMAQLDLVRGVPIQKIRDWLEKPKESLHIHETRKENANSFTDEDEKIRKKLIWQVQMNVEDETADLQKSVYNGVKGHDPDLEESIEDWKKCLAWLEKQKEHIPYIDFVIKPHKGDDTNPYDMSVSEAQEYAINRGFGIPFNDGEVYVDERHMTQTIGNILRWADEHPKEQKPAEWSEEDERILKGIIGLIDHDQHYGVSNKEMISWLKDRRPQPLTVSIKDATNFGNLEYERGVKDGIQSEKSRHWKPIEEQMGALNYAYCELFKREDVGHNILGPLQNLIDTLSKL